MSTFKQIVIFFIGLIIGLILLDWGFAWLTVADTLLNICGVFLVCFGFFAIAFGIFPNVLMKSFRRKNKINKEDDGMEY